MKILLLEDDNFICESIKSYFELDGNKVDFFNDGEELLDNAILTNYDIFLFDINTPKKNGFETLKAIRDDGVTTPAIYLTAQSDIEHVKQGYALGCSDYVRKPFILDELELRINQILHKDLDCDNVKITESYSFNLCSMQLTFHGESIDLKQQEKDLLYISCKKYRKYC